MGLLLNRRVVIAVIAIVAVSIAGAVGSYTLLASDNAPFMGTMVYQSNVVGATVTMLGPDEILRTGAIGENGELTFTDLPEGDYQSIYVKDGYTTGVVASSIDRGVTGGRTPVVINMGVFPANLPLYASTNPSAASIKQGGSKTVTAMITSLSSFSGGGSLDCMQLPPGVTATFSPTNVTRTAGGGASSTLTLAASSSAAKGFYHVELVYSTEQQVDTWLALLLRVS